MGKMSEIMDQYLAIKASGGSPDDIYTLREAIELKKAYQLIVQKHDNISISNVNLEDENRRLSKDLYNSITEVTKLTNELKQLRRKVEEVQRALEIIKKGSPDPESEIKRITNESSDILSRLKSLETSDIDKEISRLNALEVKEQSFRNKL